MNNNTEMDESDFSHAFSPEHEEAVLVREADGDEVIISKLSFIMGQTTQLVCNLISRFQKKGKTVFIFLSVVPIHSLKMGYRLARL